MVNKNYSRGRAFEYKVKKIFEEKGWVVFRTAGSKSPFDLIAMKGGIVLLIQCKRRDKPSKEELKKMEETAERCGVNWCYISSELDLKCLKIVEKFEKYIQ